MLFHWMEVSEASGRIARAMKRAILTATVVLCVFLAPIAHAGERSLTVLLAGTPDGDTFEIDLSLDGRTYTIDSVAPLEVGGGVCWHPGGAPLELLCEAPPIVGFEVDAGPGDDLVAVGAGVPVPVTILGGAGADRLLGGGGQDRIAGETGNDWIAGGGGADQLFGNFGDDTLVGGAGDDQLRGESGEDSLSGGVGNDRELGGPGNDMLAGGPGDDRLNGGGGSDQVYGGTGNDAITGGRSDRIEPGPGKNVVL